MHCGQCIIICSTLAVDCAAFHDISGWATTTPHLTGDKTRYHLPRFLYSLTYCKSPLWGYTRNVITTLGIQSKSMQPMAIKEADTAGKILVCVMMLTIQLWKLHWLLLRMTSLRSANPLDGWCVVILCLIIVQAENADVLIMLIHHNSCTNHTTLKGSYDVMRIQKQRHFLLFCHSFAVVILFLPLPALEKPLYLTCFVLGTVMNSWTSSLMYRLVRMW